MIESRFRGGVMWLCNSGGVFSGVYSGVSDVHERLCKL